MQRYTFLQHPFYDILLHSRQMISGLDKCVAVFYEAALQQTMALHFNGDFSSIEAENESFFNEIRNSSKKTNWIKPENVPFEMRKDVVEQLSFIDEEKSSVLELRFKNPDDGRFDVLYLYFKNNIANFRLTNNDEAMAITLKEVIQNLLYNQLVLTIQSSYTNRNIHKKVAASIDNTDVLEKSQQLEEQLLTHTKNTYQYILEQITVNEAADFALSDLAVKKLMQLNFSLEQVRQVLVQTVEILINKYSFRNFYEIGSHDIILPKYTESNTSVVQQKLNKTAQFLDRYEQAAKRLIAKGEKITGTNIGSVCEPSISAAAISDILKKHQRKITQLLLEHPDKWELIRNYFRPIKALQNSKHLSISKGA